MAEQNQEQQKGQFRQFWATWRGWVVLGLVLLAIVALLAGLALAGVIKTGFGESPGDSHLGIDGERAKTLWNWMELFLVPLALALGAAFFTWVTNKREREIEDQRALAAQKATDQRAQTEREIAADRTREAAYQGYLDRMTDLLKENLQESEPDNVKRSIARARTLAVLRQLDRERKGLLLRFLYESDLTGGKAEEEERSRKAIVDLSEADLDGASLYGANLTGADLSEAYLVLANLSGADLIWADLRGADLRKASLREANLQGAKVTSDQLAQAASLEGATLPDGTKNTGTKYILQEREHEPEETEADSAERQPDLPGDLDAGEEVDA